MVGKILIPEIKSLIDTRSFGALRELFSDWPPADVAMTFIRAQLRQRGSGLRFYLGEVGCVNRAAYIHIAPEISGTERWPDCASVCATSVAATPACA